MRLYIPSTVSRLREVWRDGLLTPAKDVGTVGVLAWVEDHEDVEELEYLALQEAAAASLLLIVADRAVPVRRVVLAVELDQADLALPARPPEGSPSRVPIDRPVPLTSLVAVYADDVRDEGALQDAANALSHAGHDDPAARARVEAVRDIDLLWHATQEIPLVIDG